MFPRSPALYYVLSLAACACFLLLAHWLFRATSAFSLIYLWSHQASSSVIRVAGHTQGWKVVFTCEQSDVAKKGLKRGAGKKAEQIGMAHEVSASLEIQNLY